MHQPLLKADHLSKLYRIGALQKSHATFREAVMERLKSPLKNTARSGGDTIKALDDVSFDVSQGEVLGIIGRNGAGKTTLLKILSRITEPTGGSVEIHGRLASLLEVGTGFHPELTGRENIFLNGAILGMHRQEIKDKFQEILRFSEIEKFIDTPIKRYSSGMYVRLAFAVAAHLEPEILLVDEVLAVGDIAFQEKCLGKMEGIAKSGRTILFVSHNMGAIRSLCENAIWLDNGRIVKRGPAGEVVRDYEEHHLNRFHESSYLMRRNPEDVRNTAFYIKQVEILNAKGEHATVFKYNDRLTLLVDFGGELGGGDFSPEFHIYNELGQMVSVGASGPYHGIYFNPKVKRIKIEIGPLSLTLGKYRILLSVMTGHVRADTWESAIGFTIAECQPFTQSWDILTYREGTCVIGQSFSEIK